MSRRHDCSKKNTAAASISQAVAVCQYTLLLVLMGQNYQRTRTELRQTFGIYQFPCLITLLKRLQQLGTSAVTRPVESTVLERSEVCYASSGQRIC